MKVRKENKSAIIRVVFKLTVDYSGLRPKGEVEFYRLEAFGLSFNFCIDETSKSVEEIAIESIPQQPHKIFNKLQILESGFYEMVAQFNCTAEYKGNTYEGCAWDLSEEKTCQLSDEDISQLVLNELKDILDIKEDPVFVKVKKWGRAIPQYRMGYQ